jgi:hypothetical protein
MTAMMLPSAMPFQPADCIARNRRASTRSRVLLAYSMFGIVGVSVDRQQQLMHLSSLTPQVVSLLPACSGLGRLYGLTIGRRLSACLQSPFGFLVRMGQAQPRLQAARLAAYGILSVAASRCWIVCWG